MAKASSIGRLYSADAARPLQLGPERGRQTDAVEENSMLAQYQRYLATTRVRGHFALPDRNSPALLNSVGPVKLPAGRATFADVAMRERLMQLATRRAGCDGDPQPYMHLAIQA